MTDEYKEDQRAGICETSWNDNQEDDSSQKDISVSKLGTIVSKDEAKREVTTPVMIPDCKDCDGESFTVDEVAKFCREYNAQFRLADKMHVLNGKGDVIGDSVENWTLKNDETITNVLGETVTLPMGTWMTTIKINDDDTWREVENGTLKGASGMYVPRTKADELLKNFTSDKRVTKICECLSADKRTKITDIEDPVAISIALVDRPCVANAIATSIKSNFVQKAGRMFSDANMNMMQKMKDMLDKLMQKAQDERKTDSSTKNNKPSIKEVDDMNEDEVKELIKKQVEDARKEDKETIDSLKAEVEELKKAEPEPVEDEPVEKSEKEKQAEQEEAWKSYNDELEKSPVIGELQKGIKAINDKLGIDPAKKGLEGQEDTESTEEVYKGRKDRDAFGRKIKE
jgi:hypothetical protein